MTERVLRLKSSILARYPTSRLLPIGAATARALRDSFAGIPDEYIDLLTELGWGSIGDEQFMLYQGPVEPATVFGPDVDPSLRALVLIGDDFAGHHAAYDTSTQPWRFLELDHTRPAELDSAFHQDVIAYLEAWYIN